MHPNTHHEQFQPKKIFNHAYLQHIRATHNAPVQIDFSLVAHNFHNLSEHFDGGWCGVQLPRAVVTHLELRNSDVEKKHNSENHLQVLFTRLC